MHTPDLVGRQDECARIAELLDDARAGTGASMAIVGQPGIGKSTLLTYAASVAGDMRVLRAYGVEVEAGLGFAALSDVLRPLERHRRALPPGQADVLAQAMGLRAAQLPDRFAVCVSALTVLTAAAQRQPVLVCVDDAHLIDPPSLETLLFLTRRLVAEPVVMMFAARSGHGGLRWPSSVRVLELDGLDRDAAYALATRSCVVAPAPAVLERLVLESRGNPLALAEMPAQLTEGQLVGARPLPDPLPAGPTLDQVFRRRILALPEPTRRALLVVAVSGPADLDTIGQGLATLGLGLDVLEAAEDAGLVSVDLGRVVFGHPLIRAAVCHSVTAAERRAAHRAVASACSGPYALERRAYHLAEAALGPDEQAAALLERAAEEAERRGGQAGAAGMFARAARLSHPGHARARRLVAAARCVQRTDQIQASKDMLTDALAQTQDPVLCADANALLADAMIWNGEVGSGHRLLVAQTDVLQRDDPRRAALMLANAAVACFLNRDISAAMMVARRAHDLARGLDAAPRFAAAAALGSAWMFAGRPDRAEPLVHEAWRLAMADTDVSLLGLPGAAHAGMVGNCLMWMERFGDGRELLDRTITTVRGRAELSLLPFLLAVRSDLAFRTGDWPDAFAYGGEAVRLGEETGQPGQRAYALTVLARLAAAQGREADCRECVRRSLEFADLTDLRTIQHRGAQAIGALLLGKEQQEAAVAQFAEMIGESQPFEIREPSALTWAPDLIEAYIRSGRPGPARSLLDEYQALAERAARRGAIAAAHRCHALLDPELAGDHFDAALELLEQAPMPFERARTLLCQGEWLHRSGRPARARTSLRSAMAVFDRLEAGPWAARARVALRAIGDHPDLPSTARLHTLTPQEAQVAAAVASGMTNQQVAGSLFLSEKTVAFHLTNVYRKLGVRTRTQLAIRFATARPDDAIRQRDVARKT